MYWADKLIKNLDKNKKHIVDDMKTPSGHAHSGSLRAIATHGLMYEAMRDSNFDVKFTYIINDFDPMDGMPVYLDKNIYQEHMGKPVCNIPAPDGKSESFAMQYANEYISAFNQLDFKPEVKRSSEMYKQGLFNEVIVKALDNVDKIRKIYKEVADQDKPKGWYPFQVVCPKCNKIGTSLVTDWDGELVTYECKKDLVEWAVGCGEKGKMSPLNGNGSFMWKVDWPAHWKVLNITVEGAGKDHFSAGGSRDVGARIVKEVFEEEPPFGFLHEFLLIGGAKMSSSKGNASNAIDFVKMFPAQVGRFLFARTSYKTAINFDPNVSDTIPDLFDEYDKCAKDFFENGSGDNFGRFYQASQLYGCKDDYLKPYFLPRFRKVATYSQMPNIDIFKIFEEEKGSKLTEFEKEIIKERQKFAESWLKNYADSKEKMLIQTTLPISAKDLTDIQKDFLTKLSKVITDFDLSDGGDLQQKTYELSKEMGIKPKDAFGSIYQVLLGRESGPKAGWLMLSCKKDFLVNRFNFKQ